jgi:hypothetical protein
MKNKVIPEQELSAQLDSITTELSDEDKKQERNQRTASRRRGDKATVAPQ